jgi:hypothetical protein
MSSNSSVVKARRISQYQRILRDGFPTDDPCSRCLRRGEVCVMDSKSRNCASCTRYGRKCEKRFHSDKEWDALERAESKIDAELRLAEEKHVELSQQFAQTLARIVRLRKQKQFLKERGKKMLDHDTVVIDRFDEENPSEIPPSPPLEAEAQANLVDPSLPQLSESFWEQFQFPDNTTEVPAGNSSGSR